MNRICQCGCHIMTLVFSLSFATQASADSTWDGATDNLWDFVTVNWSGGIWTNNTSALFPTAATTSIAIQTGIQVQNMTITGDAYQFSGGPLDLRGSVFVASNKAATLTAPLLMTNNTSSVFTSGPGTLTLNGASNLFYNFKMTDGRVIHSSGTTTVTRTNSDPESNPAFHISNGVFEVSGGLVVVRDDKYVVIGGKNGGTSSTLLVQNGGIFIATNSIEILNAFYGMGNITVQNGGELNCRQLRVHKSTYAQDKNVVNINTGGILRLQQFTLDSGLASNQKGTINFNGGTVIPYGDNAGFLASQGSLTTWVNSVYAYIREGGCRIDTAGKNIVVWQPLLNGAAVDGGLYKSGSNDLSLRGTNTFNGGVFITSGGLNIVDDVNLGAQPAALQRSITFSNTAHLISAANNSVHVNRELFVSSNTLAYFNTLNYTQRLHGVVNAGSASNWIYKLGSGQLTLASGDTRTNTLFFMAFSSSGCGTIAHESGTTFFRHKSKSAIVTPLYITGTSNVFLLAGGSVNLPETYTDCQYVNISNGGKLWITNGLFNAANQEVLNGLTGTGTTTIQGSGILDCSTLRISQSSPPAAQTTVNIQTGGVLRLKNFYIDTANAGWGYLNLDGGRIEVKSGMVDFLGTGHTNWLNRITVYVRAGGMIISNSTSITIKNTLVNGAVQYGGLTKFGSGSMRLDNTNTYNGTTLILEGELRMGTNNALPAANAVTLQAKGVLHVADKTLTLAKLSGCGTISNCTALSITSTLETAPTGTLAFATAALAYGTNWVAHVANGQAGRIAITGDLDLSQTTLNLAADATLNREDIRYPLATYTGTLTAGFTQVNLPSRWVVKHEPATKTLYMAYNFGSVLMVK